MRLLKMGPGGNSKTWDDGDVPPSILGVSRGGGKAYGFSQESSLISL